MIDPSIVQDAKRRIEELVAKHTGRPFPLEAEQQLIGILQSLARQEISAFGARYSHRQVTILLADLRGFAAIAEAHPPEVVLDVLNTCFSAMTEIIVCHYGVIDKFMGDAIMVVFSGDQAAARDHARRAVLCAVQMQLAMHELQHSHRAAGLPEMFMGIGVNTGEVMAGLIGSHLYRAHTIIGEDVNLTSRIEAFCLRGQVLISESTYELCREFAETGEPMQVFMKGTSRSVAIREVTGIPSLGKFVPRQEMRRSPRVEVMLPFALYAMDDKVVLPEPMTGTVRDMGYHGVLAEIDKPLALYSAVKLELDLIALGYTAEDVYGRIVSIREQNAKHLLGIEFTSVGAETRSKIELFVQMLVVSAPQK